MTDKNLALLNLLSIQNEDNCKPKIANCCRVTSVARVLIVVSFTSLSKCSTPARLAYIHQDKVYASQKHGDWNSKKIAIKFHLHQQKEINGKQSYMLRG